MKTSPLFHQLKAWQTQLEYWLTRFFERSTGQKNYNFLSYIHIGIFLLIVVVLFWIKDTSIPQASLFLIIFSFIAGVSYLTVWNYETRKGSYLHDPSYGFLASSMTFWMVMGTLDIVMHDKAGVWITILSIGNSILYLLTIKNLDIDVRKNSGLKRWQNIGLKYQHILLLWGIALVSPLLDLFYIYVADLLVSIIVIVHFIFFIPSVFKERKISNKLINIILYVVFLFALLYQFLYHFSLGHLQQIGFSNLPNVDFMNSFQPFVAVVGFVNGVFYRLTLFLIFVALITTSIVKKERSGAPVDALLRSIFEADSNLRHNTKPNNLIWNKLRIYSGFSDKDHGGFITLFSSSVSLSMLESPRDVPAVQKSDSAPDSGPSIPILLESPPFALARGMSEGDRCATFSVFGVLFVLCATIPKKEDDVAAFQQEFIEKQLGLDQKNWQGLISTLSKKRIADERRDDDMGELFKSLDELLRGLHLSKSTKSHAFHGLKWDGQCLRLFYKMGKGDLDKLFKKLETLRYFSLTSTLEGTNRFGKHNVSTNLLKVDYLLNVPFKGDKLFSSKEGTTNTTIFKFYHERVDEYDCLVLQFNCMH